MADIPAWHWARVIRRFTTALLKALHIYKKNLIHHRELAEQACHIEIEVLRRTDRQAKINISPPMVASPVSSSLPNDYVEGLATQNAYRNTI